jgi:hypothetical protein
MFKKKVIEEIIWNKRTELCREFVMLNNEELCGTEVGHLVLVNSRALIRNSHLRRIGGDKNVAQNLVKKLLEDRRDVKVIHFKFSSVAQDKYQEHTAKYSMTVSLEIYHP